MREVNLDPIQLFVPTFRLDETMAEIRECLEKGWTGLGFKTVRFEQAWREYTGLPNAHFLDSATAGLNLAVKLFKLQGNWQAGDEIITTPLTFVSTNHAILHEGLNPVFADVDEMLCLDPASVRSHITERTRAVMFVGLGGNVGQLAGIVDICKEFNLKLILDAAHMTGTMSLTGRHVGQEADVSVFSFQAVKNLPTADSGMICFRDSDLDKEVRKWTWLGINKDTYTRTIEREGTYRWYYDVEYVGYKNHGNSIMAAIGLVAIKYVDQDNEYRRQIAAWYDAAFKAEPRIKPVPMSGDCIPSRHLYQVLVENRDLAMAYLNEHSIYPGVHYRDNTAYKMYQYAAGTCPVAHHASECIISLPIHMRLQEADVKRISDTLIEFIRK
jgi:dTDP-4-amino-4,6-dideoxygalactose transaminase